MCARQATVAESHSGMVSPNGNKIFMSLINNGKWERERESKQKKKSETGIIFKTRYNDSHLPYSYLMMIESL